MDDSDWETHTKVFNLIKFELKENESTQNGIDQLALDITNEIFEDFVVLPYYGTEERIR